ncbi:MAG: DNA topoisomerase IB [Chloroflexia bacterium]
MPKKNAASPPEPEIITDPVESAKAAGLRYVSYDKPGITRKRRGRSFSYFSPDGERITDEEIIARIKSLGIPPAWNKVWICPNPKGHIQATGRDLKGRKQYRYHPRWRTVRDETKYGRMIAFGQALPEIRNQVAEDLRKHGFQREKVLATVVNLLETTLIRVGNEEYARTNKSFGLTTMRNRHVEVEGSKISFKFRGKSGKDHLIEVNDRRLARTVERISELPGQELFQYLDDVDEPKTVTSEDVNDYLREITDQDFTAKDFRTWRGTVLAAKVLQEFQVFDTEAQAKKNVVEAIEKVAQNLGNTPAICRKCYVHPIVLDSYLDGTLLETLKQRTEKKLSQSLGSLEPAEAAVLAFLQQRLAQEAKEQKGA